MSWMRRGKQRRKRKTCRFSSGPLPRLDLLFTETTDENEAKGRVDGDVFDSV
jgi:hypothetical protein